MPEAQLDGCLQWSHLSSGHTGANRSVDFFCECFYSSLTLTELRFQDLRVLFWPVLSNDFRIFNPLILNLLQSDFENLETTPFL